MTKRILVADDHPVWRRGLRDLLEPAFDVVGEANEGGEAVNLALACKPDVVVIDIRMPGMDGIAATGAIREALPETAVVIVAASCEDEEIFEAIQAGACGFVAKDDAPDAIVEAVRNAAEGSAYLPPTIAKRVLQGVSDGKNQDAKTKARTPLTQRENEVLRLVAQGRRHRDIAMELNISARTVENHVSSIYNKLGIFDRVSAVVYAVKKGLVRI